MKRILLFGMFLWVLGFISCGKDNDTPQPGSEITLEGYEEPVIDFGISREELKSRVTYAIEQEDEEGILYSGSDMVMNYLYGFEYNRLITSFAVVKTMYASELGGFLAKKYTYVKTDDDEYRIYYVNKELDMIICAQVDINYILVLYHPYTDTSNMQDIRNNIKSEVKLIDDMLTFIR